MRYLIGIVFVASVLAVVGACFSATPQDRAAAALESGRPAEVMEYVGNGADVDFRYEDHTTLLHMAAVVAGADRLIADLVDAGADVHAQVRSTGSTPLHLAAGWGHPRNVQMLLDRGANRLQRDREGKTPLNKATEGRAAAAGRAEARIPDFDEVIEILSR